jgi:pimeloyl-ACP methyl ester carboxylesterase
MGSKANIVLVHGAWADGSSWSKVIPLLQQKEFNLTCAQIPLTSLADDIAVTRNLLAAQNGPTILVGHSYAGVVIPARPTILRALRRLCASQPSDWTKARALML